MINTVQYSICNTVTEQSVLLSPFQPQSYYGMSKRDDEIRTDDASWSNIDFNEIELGDRIGGGGAGIIYQGIYYL